MPEIIDTHCHLTMPEYDPDRADVIKSCQDNGVSRIITIGTDIDDSRRVVELAEKHDFIFAGIGIHPHDVKDIKNPEETYKTLKSLSSSSKVVGIGETGLDYHYMHSPAEIQQQHFRMHIKAAKELGLPLLIHSREAKEDTLKILSETLTPEMRGVFHCFSGDMDMAEKALDMGFYISFSGVITFKNANKIIDIVRAVPLDRMLVETDAPFLSPTPHRGKRNEPAYVRHVAGKVAEIKGLSIEETCKAVMKNAVELFGI